MSAPVPLTPREVSTETPGRSHAERRGTRTVVVLSAVMAGLTAAVFIGNPTITPLQGLGLGAIYSALQWLILRTSLPRLMWRISGFVMLASWVAMIMWYRHEFGVRTTTGLRIEVVASYPRLVNPVSMTIDHQNRIFVAETNCFEPTGLTYTDEELACRTCEEGRELFQQMVDNCQVDIDGSERIRLLEDRDNDGRWETATTFCDEFELLDGVAAGVVARDGQVWAGIAPHLWRLRDRNNDGRADQRRQLLSGFGVRPRTLGHDLHGLLWGPDGKLYFSVGDRGIHVRTQEGHTISVLDSGVVLRCNPDGSQLELFAWGLRNPQDLAFDAWGNLWTGDNDSNRGDKSRFVYLVEGGDSGWRVGYQSLPDIGPFGTEGIWKPETSAPYRLPAAGLAGHGPAGLAFYPGVGLPEEYVDHFFLCDFPGRVLTVTVRPRGAGFELDSLKEFLTNVWPTDVAFGSCGGVLVADWGWGFRRTSDGRILRMFDPRLEDDPRIADLSQLLRDGMSHRSLVELGLLLEHPDQRIRQSAHFELAARGKPALELLFQIVSSPKRPTLARCHAMWALGMIANRTQASIDALATSLDDADEEIRAQVARVLGESRVEAAYEQLETALRDPSARVRFFAAMGLGKLANREAVEPLVEFTQAVADQDPFLRHAAVMGLLGCADIPTLATLSAHPSRCVRLAVLLTLRRKQSAAVALFLHDRDPEIVLEVARAIYDTPIRDAMEALAALSEQANLPTPLAQRVIAANFSLGDANGALSLARFACDETQLPRQRVAAAKALGQWEQRSGRDRLLGSWRPLPASDKQIAADALQPYLCDLSATGLDELRSAAAAAALSLGIDGAQDVLAELAQDIHAAPAARAAALTNLVQNRRDNAEAALRKALVSQHLVLRREATRLMEFVHWPDRTEILRERILDEDESIPVRQAAVYALGSMRDYMSAESVLDQLFDEVIANRFPDGLRLDLLESAAAWGGPRLTKRLAEYDACRTTSDPLARWEECMEGGDAERGRELFFRQTDAQCVRCHRVDSVGGDVGPALDTVSERHPVRYLLESIVLPNASLAKEYTQTSIELDDGHLVVGRIAREDATGLVLVLANGLHRKVPRAHIAHRAMGKSAMPEGLGEILSRRILRDLVAFLETLRGGPRPGSSGVSRHGTW